MTPNQQRMIDTVYCSNVEKDLPRGAFMIAEGNIPVRMSVNQRNSITSLRNLYTFIRGNVDVFISVFADWQIIHATYDKIFIDIDHESLDEARIIARHTIKKMGEAGHKEYMVMFSGSKGYHIYFPMKETKLANYGLAVNRYLQSIGVGGYDSAVLEANRVSRVPYSKNGKSGKYCIPVNIWEDVDVMAMGKNVDVNPVACGVNEGLGQELIKFDGKSSTIDNSESKFGNSVFSEAKGEWAECMKEMADAEFLNHNQRVAFGTFLLYVHKGDIEKCMDHFKKWDNYDEGKCRYYLTYLYDKNRKMASCEKYGSMGMCPFKTGEQNNCEYYPNLNVFGADGA